MTKFHFLLLATTSLAVAAPAWAQVHSEDDGTEGRVYYVPSDDDDIVVVATGVPQAADETGRSVTVIGREEIERRQIVSISDLLATTPGVTVSRNGGTGGVTAVRIRGAEDAQTLVLIDGVRVNDPSAPAGAYDFGNLLAGSVERVEVLRGPNSVAWGSQAIGGVVNLVTAQARDGLHARGGVEYGSENSVSANAALSGGNDTVSGAVTASYYDTDGISQAAIGTEPDGYRQFGASGRLQVDFAPGLALDLRGYYADSRVDLDGYPAPAFTFADTAEYQKTQEIYGYAGLRAALGPVSNRLGFSLADVNRATYAPAAGTAPSVLARGRSERYEYQGDAQLSRRIRLVFGAEHEDSRFFDGFDRFSTGVTSVYGEAIVTPVEAVTVTAGLRNDDHDAFGSHWTWGANLAVEPLAGTTLHASYGEGFKSPTLYQLYSAFGDADLKPETARSYELGARQSLAGGKVALGATWFHRDTDQQIDFNLATFRYFNIAKTRAEGVELEAVAQPVTGLSLRAAYTHVDAENRSLGANLGKDLARRPQDAGSLSADYRFGFGLSMGGTVLMVGDSFDDAGNAVRLDGYTLVGIRAEMPVSENLALYGRVDNLFDEEYRTVATYGAQGTAVYGGVRLRFD